jgi:hypothetical protein
MRQPFYICALGAALFALAVPVQAQTVFPQQTGWSITFTTGKGSSTSPTARVRAGARVPEVAVDPGTELLIGKDGNYDYRITDPTFKFGSFYQSPITEESEVGKTNGIYVTTDFGFSVFKY